MARYDEAGSSIALLSRNTELLAEACLEHQGVILESDVPPKLITDLLGHRLAFRLDEHDQYVQVNRVVSELFHHVTQSYRRRLSSGAIEDLFDQLKHTINSYFDVSAAGNLDDRKHYELEAQEVIADLIDSLRMIIHRFSEYVRNEFSIVSNLVQRIKENERAIDEAARLNALFATITPEELSELSRSDPTLSRLLKQLLGRAVRQCTEELHDILHKLRENLARLEADKKYQRQNQLIDGMLQHYQRNPSFQPTISHYEHLPKLFAMVSPFKLNAHPPVDSPTEEHILAELAQSALSRIKTADKPLKDKLTQKTIDIVDSRGEIYTEGLGDVEQALVDLFELLPELTSLHDISSLDCLDLFSLEIRPDLWNLCVVDHFSNSRFASGKAIKISYIQKTVPGFNGNHTVEDVVFVRAHA